MQKVLAVKSLFGYSLCMTNTPTAAAEFVNYCGEEVILLSVENTEYGNLAFIQFEDGREDQVPLSTIHFLK